MELSLSMLWPYCWSNVPAYLQTSDSMDLAFFSIFLQESEYSCLVYPIINALGGFSSECKSEALSKSSETHEKSHSSLLTGIAGRVLNHL